MRKSATSLISLPFGSPRHGGARLYPLIFPGASAPHLVGPGGAPPSARDASASASSRPRPLLSTPPSPRPLQVPPPLLCPGHAASPPSWRRRSASLFPMRSAMTPPPRPPLTSASTTALPPRLPPRRVPLRRPLPRLRRGPPLLRPGAAALINNGTSTSAGSSATCIPPWLM